MLRANEGRMMKMVVNIVLMNMMCRDDACASIPSAGKVHTLRIPAMPNTTEAQMNIFVAIFCITLFMVS